MIYLDFAASAPMSELALQAYAQAAKEAYANSRSLHDEGGKASEWLAVSRRRIAALIGGSEDGLYFTGSGSEANVLAIQSLLNGAEEGKNEIIMGATEHASIRTYLDSLKSRGYVIKTVLPGKHGIITEKETAEYITDRTALITIQHANSETGLVHDIAGISRLAAEKKILFHSDCVQTFGKLPLEAESWGISALTVSSHKVHGPKGLGAAYLSPNMFWKPCIPGTSHENGFRPGTVDVPGIVSFAAAAAETVESMDREQEKMRQYREHFSRFLIKSQVGRLIEAPQPHQQLPGIMGCLLHNREGQYAMLACSQNGIAIATGSACHSGMAKPPETLLSLGIPEEEAHSFIRISTGRNTTLSHMEQVETILHRHCGAALERMTPE
ncbi:IscS subfamily cysteine desulfurase [Metabacillus mangrovi]|nr:IscS subfamily cysteine desulfurase [Metabacillus mangrovi]